MPISAPSARTSVRVPFQRAAKPVKLSKYSLYHRIKEDAPDWYTDVSYMQT